MPTNLLLYCSRHDYGCFVSSKTANLKVVMDLTGQTGLSALKNQHHEVDVARELLNSRHTVKTANHD